MRILTPIAMSAIVLAILFQCCPSTTSDVRPTKTPAPKVPCGRWPEDHASRSRSPGTTCLWQSQV